MRSAIFLLFLLLSPVALAHKKWFYDAEPYSLRWDIFWQPLPLTITSPVLLVTAGAAFFQHKRAGRDFLPTPTALGATPERLSKIYALMPAFLAVHVAVPLLINRVHTQLFSPNNNLPTYAYTFRDAEFWTRLKHPTKGDWRRGSSPRRLLEERRKTLRSYAEAGNPVQAWLSQLTSR